jgi:hypothetical protein
MSGVRFARRGRHCLAVRAAGARIGHFASACDDGVFAAFGKCPRRTLPRCGIDCRGARFGARRRAKIITKKRIVRSLASAHYRVHMLPRVTRGVCENSAGLVI